MPAWDEGNHWRGRVESYYLPRIYDPPEGFIATANENINRPGEPMLVTQPLPEYRKRRIVERLEQLPHATVTEMQQLQYDVVSTQARDLLKVFLPAARGRSDENTVGQLGLQLSSRQFGSDAVCEAVSQRAIGDFWRRRRTAKVAASAGGECCILSSRFGFSMMVLTSIDRLLAKRRIAVVGGPRQGRIDSPSGGEAGGRARSALGGIQFVPVHQSLHRRDAHGEGSRLSHGDAADARLPCHAVSGALADDRETRDDICAFVSFRD